MITGETPLQAGPPALVQPLDRRAAAWLAAEDRSIAEPRRLDLVRLAVRAAEAYEDGLAGSSPDQIERAWEAASVAQARELPGTHEWAVARRVAELLRVELAARMGVATG